MDAHDLLNENSILPELSFEDLLAFSPIKKTDSNSDSMEFESDDRRTDEDTLLNTPGPKPKAKIIMKTPTTNTTSSAAGSNSTSTIAAAALNASKLEVIPSRSASMTNLADKRTKVVGNMSGVNSSIDRIYTYKPVKIIEAPAVNTTEASTSTVAKSNMANFFTKNQKIVPTTVKHLVRVTPKSILSQATDQLKTKPTTTSLLSGSAATSVTTAAKVAPIGKTAVKTVKGQIFYINNPGGTGLPVVRLQAKSAAAIANSQTSSDTNASAATTSTSTSTVVTAKSLPVSTTASTLPTKPATVSVNANKTVTVIRTPDGKYVPLKSAITPAAAAATATTPTTTAATAATTKVLSGNKIISTSSGSYVFKSMSSATTTTTSITQKTQPTTTTTTTITKLLCKTNMVAKPKPTTDGTSGTATTTTTAIATTTTPSATQFTKIIPISSNATKTTNETSFPVKTFTIQRVNAAGAVKGGASTIIKIPMKPTTTPTTTSLLKTTITPTTAATTTPTTNSTSPKKTVMQNVMKISAGNNPTGSSTMPGKLQAVRIPGKPGVQYVRFLPTPKVPTTKTTTTTTIAKTTPTNTNTIKTIVVSKSTGKITSQSSTTPTSNTTTLSNSKLLNSNTSSLNGATIIIKKSPKEESTANTSTAALGNVQTKVQKTVVSLPSGATKVPTPTKIVVTQAALSPSMKNQLLLRKHKIAELNADSKTDNADEPEAKKAAISKHIVVLPAKLTTGLNARAVETEPLKIQQKVSSTEQPQQQQQLKQPIKPIKAEEIKPEVDVKLPIAAASKQHLQKANSNAPFKLSEELFGSTLAKIKEAAKADDFVDEELMERAIFSKKTKPNKSNKAVSVASDEVPPPVDTNSAVLVRRKHCNCSKSQCLKLYCDCFANGEFCQDCTCRDCCNNLKFEDERQRAIMICLERNPNAFKPKITSTDQGDASMRHKRGCNCKRSGCLKNYCECYEAKVPCTKYCKCVGCRNVDDAGDLDPLDPQAFATFKANVDKAINAANLKAGQKRGNRNDNNDEDSKRDLAVIGSNDNSDNEDPNRSSSAEKHPINFITTEVIGATVQCMLSQAEQCERTHFPTHHVEKLVIEELGRCLVEIIDFSIRNTDSSFSQD